MSRFGVQTPMGDEHESKAKANKGYCRFDSDYRTNDGCDLDSRNGSDFAGVEQKRRQCNSEKRNDRTGPPRACNLLSGTGESSQCGISAVCETSGLYGYTVQA